MSGFMNEDLPEATSDLAEVIQALSNEFDHYTAERHAMGEKKYGPGTWLQIDTIQHALDEVLDLGNYARFTYIRLRMLQESIRQIQADGSIAQPQPGNEMMGKASVFNPMTPK